MTTAPIQIQQLDSIPVAVIRRQAKPSQLSRVVPECCGLVFAAARGQQARVGRHIAIYWDASVCVEAGVELHGAFVTQGSIVLSATPAGRVASATHWGPYQNLGTAHQAIRHWSKSSNERLAGPNWEIYGHWQPTWNAKPAEIRTDIYYLLSGSS